MIVADCDLLKYCMDLRLAPSNMFGSCPCWGSIGENCTGVLLGSEQIEILFGRMMEIFKQRPDCPKPNAQNQT